MRRQDFVRQKVKRLTEVAKWYEAEREAAIDRSGLPDARCRMFHAYRSGCRRDRAADARRRRHHGAGALRLQRDWPFSENKHWGTVILGKPLAVAVARLG